MKVKVKIDEHKEDSHICTHIQRALYGEMDKGLWILETLRIKAPEKYPNDDNITGAIEQDKALRTS